MQENIDKAANTISFVIADLRLALNAANKKQDRTLADKALAAYLSSLLENAHQLQCAIMAIES